MIGFLRRQLRMAFILVATPAVMVAATLVRWFTRGDAATIDRAWTMRWARMVRPVLGLDLRVEGKAPAVANRARLVVANHRTPLDILALLQEFDGGRFLANHRVANAPIIGRASQRAGTLFVDRDDRRSGANAIRAMRRACSAGDTLIVFPEGTTFEGDEVQPFKAGALVAIKGVPIDVVPVGIAYTPGHELGRGKTGPHVRSFLSRRRTPICMVIGEPIEGASLSTRGGEEELRARVQELVNRARALASR